MRTKILVTITALLAVGATISGPATASARISCHLVRDASGDTHLGAPQAAAPTDEAALDIVAADVASDDRWVTAAVDVRSLAGNLPIVDGAWRWSVRFTAGATYIFHGRLGAGGIFGEVMRVYVLDDATTSWIETGPITEATVHLDHQRQQVRISVARHALDATGGVPIGVQVTGVRAYTWHEHTAYTSAFTQPGGEYDLADTATSRASYVAGTPSCVKPGS